MPRSRGPMAHQMCTRADLRQFCHHLVAHARDLLEERLPGNRFVIAGMRTPPLVCCGWHFLPPTLGQAQQYYDTHLQRHFGQMVLRDTACVQFDYTLIVERQDSVHRRLWLWPCEEGVDSTYGDIEGSCLAEIATPRGFCFEPSVRSGWFRLMRLQPEQFAGQDPVTDIVRTPPGLSSSSGEDVDAAQPHRTLTADEQRLLARWSRRNARMLAPMPSSSTGAIPAAADPEVLAVRRPPEIASSISKESPVHSVSSSAEILDEPEGSSMLQTYAARLAPSARHQQVRMRVLAADRQFAIDLSPDATAGQVSECLASMGRAEGANDLVPLCPACLGLPDFLLRPVHCHCVAVAIHHLDRGTVSLRALPMSAVGSDLSQLCAGEGLCHMTFAGRPLADQTSLFDGMVLQVSTIPRYVCARETTPAQPCVSPVQDGVWTDVAVGSSAQRLSLETAIPAHMARPHNIGICGDMLDHCTSGFALGDLHVALPDNLQAPCVSHRLVRHLPVWDPDVVPSQPPFVHRWLPLSCCRSM